MTGGAATEGKQGGQGLAAALSSLKLPLGLLLLIPVAPVLHYLLGASSTWVFLAGALAVAVLAGPLVAWRARRRARRARRRLDERVAEVARTEVLDPLGETAEDHRRFCAAVARARS